MTLSLMIGRAAVRGVTLAIVLGSRIEAARLFDEVGDPRPGDGLSARAHGGNFAVDVGEVVFDGALRDGELKGDIAVGEPAGRSPQNGIFRFRKRLVEADHHLNKHRLRFTAQDTIPQPHLSHGMDDEVGVRILVNVAGDLFQQKAKKVLAVIVARDDEDGQT